MSDYECPRLEDAAVYVLRGLPDGESADYRYHVDECEQCAEKVAELAFVSDALLSAAPQYTSPAEIRDRVMNIVRAEAELLSAAGATADRPVQREARRFVPSWFGLPAAGALAAVLVVVGLGLGAQLTGGESGPCVTRAADTTLAGRDASGTLTVCDGSGSIAFTGLRALPSGQDYQVWHKSTDKGAKPVSVGVLDIENGAASRSLKSLHRGEAVLVTIEPAGGSKQPTSDQIVTAIA